MDIEAKRDNERFKAIAGLCDSAAFAVVIACVKRTYDGNLDGLTSLLIVLGALIGVAFLVMAWHIRGLIQSED